MKINKRSISLMMSVMFLFSMVFPIQARAAVGSADVNVVKTVNPSEITTEGEAEVSLSVKGSLASEIVPNDVIVVVDESGSMSPSNNNGEDKMGNAKNASLVFVDKLKESGKHRVGVVGYSGKVKRATSLTSDFDSVKKTITDMQATDVTNTGGAIRKATELLSAKRQGAQPVIVLLTDGDANVGEDGRTYNDGIEGPKFANKAAQEAKAAGIVFYTVALLSEGAPQQINDRINNLMKGMATTEQHHHFVFSSHALLDVYAGIAKEIGVASAKNVIVEDVVSPEFEIVPGSYENSIPRPTVSGNKITWNLTELKDKELTFKYKIKVKDKSKFGKFPVSTGSKVSYEDYFTQQRTEKPIESPELQVNFLAPTVTSVEPKVGLTSGDESVTIKGTNFKQGVKVAFGDNEVAPEKVTRIDETTIAVKTPAAQVAGDVDVKVTNVDNKSVTFSKGYTYKYPAPTVTSLSATTGFVAGGEELTIKGTNFLPEAKVSFGNNEATDVKVVDANTITLKVPAAQVAGKVAVKVTNTDGQFATATEQYEYKNAAPSIATIAPAEGELAGGETITIKGTGFLQGAQVDINDKAATGIVVVDSETITAKVPAATVAGMAKVKVTNPDNQYAEKEGYKYNELAPSIASITPNEGFVTGGNEVTIKGANFQQGAKVKFADKEGTNVQVVDNSTIKVTVPASAKAEKVMVTVINPDNREVKFDGYSYKNLPPKINTVTPNNGELAGGQLVIIEGTNFNDGSKILIGGKEARISTFYGSTKIRVIVPAGTVAGAVNVDVVNPDGQKDTLPNGYNYNKLPAPEVKTVTPNEGLVTGGDIVVVKGINFKNGAKVKFGNNEATIVSSDSESIRVKVPAVTDPAVVTVTVVNPDAQEHSLTPGYTYKEVPKPAAPEVKTVTPNVGELTGGNLVIIEGTDFQDGLKVQIGGKDARISTFFSSTKVRVIAPAGTAAGAVDVVVINPDGLKGTLPNGYTYNKLPQPTVTTVTPNEGLVTGGEFVVINGTNFQKGAKVKFGDNEAAIFSFDSSSIKVKVPEVKEPGVVAVTVVNPDGQKAELAPEYTYKEVPKPAAPTVTAVTPKEGELAGGNLVIVEGTDFKDGLTVQIGGKDARISTFFDSTRVRVIAPAGTVAGAVKVEVINPDKQNGSLENGYTYKAADSGSGTGQDNTEKPTITSITPNSGELKGGTLCIIEGTGFQDTSTVKIGGNLAKISTFYDSTKVRVIVPASNIPGAADVEIINPNGKNEVFPGGYTYNEPPKAPKPVINSITPNSGLIAGGQLAIIEGANFQDGLEVMIGNNKARISTFYGSTKVRVIVPAGADYGTVDVKVINPDKEFGTLPGGYTYTEPPKAPDPVITKITPNSGKLEGGQLVIIEGENFQDGLEVMIGNNKARVSTFYNSTKVRVIAPAGADYGSVDVKIINPDKTTGKFDGGYTYNRPAPPNVTKMTPNSGLIAGGELVILEGSDFQNELKVLIGGKEAKISTFYDSSKVRVIVPAGTAEGTVEVKLINPDGQNCTAPGGYTYNKPAKAPSPVIKTITPNSGLLTGSQLVIIEGENFQDGLEVMIGNNKARISTFYGSTKVRVIVPAGVDYGSVDVKVINPDKQFDTLSGGYTYNRPPKAPDPIITKVTANSGNVSGGQLVIIEGENFQDGLIVKIGGKVARISTYYGSTKVRVITPAGVAGPADIEIINPDSGNCKKSGLFTYL